jgi:hypothetical protein
VNKGNYPAHRLEGGKRAGGRLGPSFCARGLADEFVADNRERGLDRRLAIATQETRNEAACLRTIARHKDIQKAINLPRPDPTVLRLLGLISHRPNDVLADSRAISFQQGAKIMVVVF